MATELITLKVSFSRQQIARLLLEDKKIITKIDGRERLVIIGSGTYIKELSDKGDCKYIFYTDAHFRNKYHQIKMVLASKDYKVFVGQITYLHYLPDSAQ